MSEYSAIRAVTLSLQNVLREHITNSPGFNNTPIDLRSPREMRQAGVNGVSVWLYRITRDPDLLNHPRERVGFNVSRRQPLPIYLYYLVTPLAATPDVEQLLLGRVLQVLHDHAILRGALLEEELNEDEFRLTFETLTLEELSRVWHALQESYQLSVSYVVQVVRIDSDIELVEGSAVVSRDTTYAQIVESRT